MLVVFGGNLPPKIVEKFNTTKTGRKRKTLYFTFFIEDTATVKIPNTPDTAPKKSVPTTAYKQGEYR